MPKTKIYLAISVLILATLACNALIPLPESDPTQIVEPAFPQPQGNLPLTEADVPRVPVEAALAAFHSGAAVFMDVRSADNFGLSHIPRAINIPVDEIEANPAIVTLDKDQWIITYCT